MIDQNIHAERDEFQSAPLTDVRGDPIRLRGDAIFWSFNPLPSLM